MRSAGGKSWLLSTGVLLGGLLILAIATRRHAPRAAPALQANAIGDGRSSPHSADGSVSGNSSESDGLSLYDPNSEGADPNWARPAKLDEAQLHDAATKLQGLLKDVNHYGDEWNQLNVNRSNLEQASGLLLQRMSGEGLRDKSLPTLWRRVMNRPTSNAPAQMMADMATGTVLAALILRTQSALGDVLSGSPTVGDKLFVDAATKYMSAKVAAQDREIDDTVDLCKRLITEFPELEITFFDKDGVSHNQTEAPPVLVSKDDMNAMRAAIPEYAKQLESYSSLLHLNDERKDAIARLREDVLASGNAKISAKWAEVVRVKTNSGLESGFSPNLVFGEITQPSDDLLAGQVTVKEKAKFDQEAALFKKANSEAQKEFELQMEFADLVAKEDSRLAQFLRLSISGYIPKYWGNHLN